MRRAMRESWKGEARVLAIILSCVLIFQGCAGVIVRRAEKPYETKVISEKPEKVLFISKVPAGTYPTLRLSRNYKVADMEDRMRKEGGPGQWETVINTEPVLMKTWGRKGKTLRAYTGWVQPGHIFPAKLEKENYEGKLYKVPFMGRCGNSVDDLWILKSPKIVIIAERYRDTDYTPAIWAGVAGLLAGLGLGYLFWFGSGETIVSAAAEVCSSGGPAPR